ncbi:MAG: SDR family oxidoreductase [Chloroflexota bacterium]
MDFHDRNVIVTGGSSGIGKATAKLLVRRGANVAIIARRQALLDAALTELEAERVNRAQLFQACAADLSDWEQAQSSVSTVTAGGRVPDVLINCAGMARPGYFEELSVEIFRQTMDVDFFGTLYPCKLVAPVMMERGSGHIVNFSSGAGFLGVFGYTAYSAAKFAIRGFSDVLRSELKPYGVGVSIVFPPDTDTPQLLEENKYKPLETERISGTIKPVQPEQVAQAVVQAIEQNRYVVIPNFELSLFYALTNGVQGFVRWYFDRVIASARKERGSTS